MTLAIFSYVLMSLACLTLGIVCFKLGDIIEALWELRASTDQLNQCVFDLQAECRRLNLVRSQRVE